MALEGNRNEFIQQHKPELLPLVEDGIAERIREDRTLSRGDFTDALERFETKVLTYERSAPAEGARRFLFEAAQGANYSILAPLLKSLQQEERCAGITLLTDNVAAKHFEAFGGFHAVRSEGKPVMSDIPSGPYDTAFVMDEPSNSPDSLILHGAKSVFDAKKLYFYSVALFGDTLRRIAETPGALKRPLRDGTDTQFAMDSVDGIFTADDFTKDLLCGVLNIPVEKVVVVGSPLLDSLDASQSETLRAAGRGKLGIPDTARVVYHSSIVALSFAPFGGAKNINQTTYERTLEGVLAAARADPSTEYVFLLRTHPRTREVDPLPPPPTELPDNLKIVNGDSVSYDEAVYASDILCNNILSTETLIAPYRSRQSLVFAYPGEGQFGALVERMYGTKGMDIIRESGRATFVDSPESLATALVGHVPHTPIPKPAVRSTVRLREILLAD